MKKAIVLISVLLLTFNSGFAQADATYKVALKKMLDAAGTEATFKTAIKQMFDVLKDQKTEVPDSVWTDFEKEFLNTSIDDLVDMLSPIYQKYMTVADLEKIVEFYKSPVGKKYAEKTPFIMQESMQVGQAWGAKIGQKFQDRLKEKGY